MLNGIFVINSFLVSWKFQELYEFFKRAAEDAGISLSVASAADLLAPVGQKIAVDADFVLFWDKDIPLAKRLEQQGLRTFNSADAILCCDDKALTAQAIADKGLPAPKTVIAPKTFSNIGYSDFRFLDRAEVLLGYPLIIKHRFGSFGAQVFLAQDRNKAEKILASAGGNEVLLQEFIAESKGRDLRINIVGEEMRGCLLRYNDHDFRSNITAGGSMKEYHPSREAIDLAIAATKAVGVDFAGVDVLFGKDGPILCEVNASPHFKTTYQATGINLANEILSYIKGEMR